MKRQLLLLLALGCVLSAAGRTLGDDADSDKRVAAEMRRLIPAAAGLEIKAFDAVFAATNAAHRGVEFTDFKSQPFTILVLVIQIQKDATREQLAEFDIAGGGSPDAAALSEAISKSKQHGYGTAIQPEFISKLTCKVSGDTAKGIVSFVVKSVPMHGNIHYVAKKQDGKWRIIEFSLPAWKITTKLIKGGKWKLTRDELKSIE